MSNTVSAFLALMLKFNIVHNDTAAIAPMTEYLDKPVKNELFYGYDAKGRIFVNIPLVGNCSPEMEKHYATTEHEWRNTAFTVFQRYTNIRDMFALGGELYPMSYQKILGDNTNDLTKLEEILAGNTPRFFVGRYVTKDGELVWEDDADRWLEVTLQKVPVAA